ncbi:hypothetical protein D3C83_24970 [compost metagenome]
MHYLGEIDRFEREPEPGGLDARQFEEVRDQAFKSFGVALDNLGKAQGCFAIVQRSAQRFRGGPHRRNRGAQFMGCVRHEIAAQGFQPSQLGYVKEHRQHASRHAHQLHCVDQQAPRL